jgi:hypothetical protein
MKKYIYIGSFIIVLIAAVAWQNERIRVISAERNAYRQNTYALLSDVAFYQTQDSLNAVSVNQLELKLSEINRFRSEDMKRIESLEVDKSRLQQIISAQTQTIYELSGTFHDSIIYVDHYIQDTVSCISINDYWFDLEGCIDNSSKFAGTLVSRDSILCVEHVVPKQFWFIRWGVKERRLEIVSANPYTKIVGAEFITVRK